jgi:uncharacterized membrane protein
MASPYSQKGNFNLMNSKTKTIIYCALLAAIYTAITLIFAPLSFGTIQIRFSEALTLLAVFSPLSVVFVSIGCFVSNLIGLFIGQTTLLDVFLGPLATLGAAAMSYVLRNIRFKGIPLLAALMPVVFNGVIIGAMITFYGEFTLPLFLVNMLSVSLGESIACFALGLPLVHALEKRKLDIKLFGTERHN